MKMEPRVRVNCPTHKRTTIAGIYLNDEMALEVVLLSEPQTTKREPQETRVGLEDARADRWLKTGIQETVLTWCVECGKEHSPPFAWLREAGETPGKTVYCPCGAESPMSG
jgi:hypothetical protein